MEHCTVSHWTSSPWYTVHTYPQQVPRVHTIGHTNRDWCMYYEYTSGNAVRCSAIQYTARPLHTVLQVPQLGTLGITGTQYSTYPECSWLVLCVVLCYAIGVLCYVPVCYAMYYIPLLHHPSHVTYYTEVWRILLMGPWLRRCSVVCVLHYS